MSPFLLRLLSAWYTWGIFVFCLIGLGMLALVIYDTRTQRHGSLGWPLLVGLPLLLLLPGLALAFSRQDAGLLLLSGRAAVDFIRQLTTWFVVALPGALIPVIAGAVYIARMARTQVIVKGSGTGAGTGAAPKKSLATPPHLANAWLIRSGDGRRTYQLSAGDTRIGRSSDQNEIVLSDPAASREHVLIRCESGRFTLFDRGSRTGTSLNGSPVLGPVLLLHGDRITIGDTSLEFVTDREER